MNYKETVWKKIGENTPLKREIARALGVGENAVVMAVRRKSKSLTKYAAVQVLRKELGLSDNQLFEKSKSN